MPSQEIDITLNSNLSNRLCSNIAMRVILKKLFLIQLFDRVMIFWDIFELMLPWTKFYFVLRVIISLGRVSFDDVSLFSWSLWWYLNTKSKSTQKIKIRPDVDEILKNSLTEMKKSPYHRSYHGELSYQNILDLSTRTLIQNFFEIFEIFVKMTSSTLILNKQSIPIDEESIFATHQIWKFWATSRFWMNIW